MYNFPKFIDKYILPGRLSVEKPDRRPLSSSAAGFAAALLIASGLAVLAGGCRNADTGTPPLSSSSEDSHTESFFCMDTYFTLTAYGSHAEEGLARAKSTLQDIDAMLSTGKEESLISRLNSGETGLTLPEDVSRLLLRAVSLSGDTGGAFSITLYPLSLLWGFPTHEYRVPDAQEIQELLPLCNSSRVTADPDSGTVTLSPGTQIDLGGIGKGYGSAKAIEALSDAGVTSALVNLGGNVHALGAKPHGAAWRVGIQDPEDAEKVIAVISLQNMAVITSGAYERYFEENGKRYHHILDPETGAPAESDLLSATIISDDSVLCDALSTALFVMGSEKAAAYWKTHADSFDFLLYTKDHRILVSEGIADKIKTDCPVSMISRP